MALGNLSLYSFNSSTGTIIPDVSVVKSAITSEFTEIFGSSIDTSVSTKIGRLIESLTMMFVEILGVNAQNANQLNPNIATGSYLDAIGALFNIGRTSARKTIVNIRCAGVSGTVIPASSAVGNDNGEIFLTKDAVTIGESGVVDVVAESQETGRFSGDITSVKTAISGWNSVSTVSIQAYGSGIESDSSYRERIKSAQGRGTSNIGSIVNAVYNSDSDVKSVVVYENGTGAIKLENGVSIFPHSIYICVYGGQDTTKIATAIFNTKTIGANYTNSLEYGTLVTEDIEYPANSGNSYTVQFYRPSPVTTIGYAGIEIYIRRIYNASTSANDIKNAIKEYVIDKGIGGTLLATEAALYLVNHIDNISVQSITFDGRDNWSFYGYEIGVINDSNITVHFI